MWLSYLYKKSAQLRTLLFLSVTTTTFPGNLPPTLQPSVLYYETRGWWRGKYVNWFGVLVEKGVVLFIGVLELLSIISGDRCGNLRSNEQSAPIAITVWVEYNDRHVSVLNSSYCSSITKRNYVLESFLPVFQQKVEACARLLASSSSSSYLLPSTFYYYYLLASSTSTSRSFS